MDKKRDVSGQNPENSYGKRLRRVRLALGASQKSLAFRVGIHAQTIANVESDKNRMNVRSVMKLARYMNCNAYHLLAYLEGDRSGIPEFVAPAPVKSPTT